MKNQSIDQWTGLVFNLFFFTWIYLTSFLCKKFIRPLVVITAILDVKSFLIVKSRIGTDQGNSPSIDKIPFYASLISTAILFSYLAMAMALGNFITNFSPMTKFYMIMTLSTLVYNIRNPIVGLYIISNPDLKDLLQEILS